MLRFPGFKVRHAATLLSFIAVLALLYAPAAYAGSMSGGSSSGGGTINLGNGGVISNVYSPLGGGTTGTISNCGACFGNAGSGSTVSYSSYWSNVTGQAVWVTNYVTPGGSSGSGGSGGGVPSGYHCTMTATPSIINEGERTSITWESTSRRGIIRPTIGAVAGSGSKRVTPAETTTYRGDFYIVGGAAVACRASVRVTVRPQPTCTISVSPRTITQGQSVRLSWSSSNATSGTISPGVGAVGRSGSRTLKPSQTTTYNGTFTGPGGSAACMGSSRTVTVISTQPTTTGNTNTNNSASTTGTNQNGNISTGFCLTSACNDNALGNNLNPRAWIGAIPLLIHPGGSSVIEWGSNDVESCNVKLSGDTIYSATSGRETINNVNEQQIYTVDCLTTAGATVTDSVTISVVPVWLEN